MRPTRYGAPCRLRHLPAKLQEVEIAPAGPYALVLRTADATQPLGALERVRSHGARIEFERAGTPAPAVNRD